MKWKFQRENHKRQDKVWQEPSNCVGGKEPARHWEAVVQWNGPSIERVYWKLNPQVDRVVRKAALVERFKNKVQCLPLIVEGYKFRFSYDRQDFINANESRSAAGAFARIRGDAEESLRIVIARMCRAKLEVRREWDDRKKEAIEVYSLPCDLSKFLKVDDSV